MDKIEWCCHQKRGVKLVECNSVLSESYIREADDSLEVCAKIEGKWKIISGYYACYNGLYSILMKCGIKSEIHDCTLELMNLFDFLDEEKKFVKELKEKRIIVQYYLKNALIEDEEKISSFVAKCKEILYRLNSEDIENIRNKIGRIENE
ncbi:MAG: hypothetical protein KJ592_05155 [Nanoarchaeota archaeon]|nr:hypothetical protein [Nanoarchaeota archaeon]